MVVVVVVVLVFLVLNRLGRLCLYLIGRQSATVSLENLCMVRFGVPSRDSS